MSKGRNVRSFGRVNLNRQDIVGIKIEVGRQFKRKRCVSALVLAEVHSVEPNVRSGHHPFEIDEDPSAPRFLWKLEVPPVYRNELVVLFVETLPGQPNIGVRNHDSLKS